MNKLFCGIQYEHGGKDKIANFRELHVTIWREISSSESGKNGITVVRPAPPELVKGRFPLGVFLLAGGIILRFFFNLIGQLILQNFTLADFWSARKLPELRSDYFLPGTLSL